MSVVFENRVNPSFLCFSKYKSYWSVVVKCRFIHHLCTWQCVCVCVFEGYLTFEGRITRC